MEKRIFVNLSLIILAVLSLFLLNSASAADSYPWINTILYENIKEAATYTSTEADFVADHYDIAVAHLQFNNDRIQERNPDIKILPFTGFGELNSCGYCQELRQLFFQAFPQYNEEDIYLHYACNTLVGGVNIPGCAVLDWNAGTCAVSIGPDCISTASLLSQSRVPDPAYQAEGWLLPNFNSEAYRAFGVWELQAVLAYYTTLPNDGTHPAQGIFQDNILIGSPLPPSIENTIEYQGRPAAQGFEEYHPYRVDQRSYFEYITEQAEVATGRQLFWAGNANHMWWLRSKNTSVISDSTLGPFYSWLISNPNLDLIAVEWWTAPIMKGEYNMPSWMTDCPYLTDVWNYTVNNQKAIAAFTYNWLWGVPDHDSANQGFSLATYYLVKNPLFYYSYSEEANGEDLMTTEWNRMAEADIGQPRTNPAGYVDFDGQQGSSKYFDWNNPTTSPSCTSYDKSNVVMARFFDNGLVLARYKGYRCPNSNPDCQACSPDCTTSYADERTYNLANPLGSLYYVVQPDGSLSALPMASVSLKTNEAVILINADVCQEGAVQACTSGGCAGTETCTVGNWGSCVKDDLCCGVICDDFNACTIDTCSLGTCAYVSGAFHPADQNCNTFIDTGELQSYVTLWLSGQVSVPDLISAISIWKNG
ncbi:MAG: hypothetical protein V1743_04795 [Nanoarchaeota archaeon]